MAGQTPGGRGGWLRDLGLTGRRDGNSVCCPPGPEFSPSFRTEMLIGVKKKRFDGQKAWETLGYMCQASVFPEKLL